MTVVLLPVVARFGTAGRPDGRRDGRRDPRRCSRWPGSGRYVRYLPMPVVEGFTAGIAVVIALQQVPAALGVSGARGRQGLAGRGRRGGALRRRPVRRVDRDRARRRGDHARRRAACARRAVLAARRSPPRRVLAQVLPLGVPLIGAIPAGCRRRRSASSIPRRCGAMLPSALAIAALAALESLLSATVADGMSVNHTTDPDRELFGQGLANLAAPVFGGVPATGAIARTAVNVRAGASSKLSAVVHAVVLAVDRLRRRAARRPDPARRARRGAVRDRGPDDRERLAAGARALDPRRRRGAGADVHGHRRRSTSSPRSRSVSASRSCSRCAPSRRRRRLDEVPLETGDHSAEEHALLAEHIVAYRLDGPLVFAAAHRFLLELSDVADVRVVILRMSRVSTIDATGAARARRRDHAARAARHRRPALRRRRRPRGRPGGARRRGSPAPRRAAVRRDARRDRVRP